MGKTIVAKNRLEREMSEGRVKIHFTETQKAMMAARIKNFPTKGDLIKKERKLASKTKGWMNGKTKIVRN